MEQQKSESRAIRLIKTEGQNLIGWMPDICLRLLAAFCFTAGLDYYFDRTCSLAHYTGENFAAAEMFGLALFAILMIIPTRHKKDENYGID